MNVWLLILIGWVASSIVMSLLWLWQKTTGGKSGMVDVAWPLTVGTLAVFFCVTANEGLVERRIVIAALALLWAVRLSWHIWTRLQKETDDSRYLQLRESWGEQFQSRLFSFYQLQAFGGLLFALPMLIAARNPEPLGWLDYSGIVIWVVAIVGESLADAQLKRFKTDPNNKGNVCQTGLWRYSRHPNYFFEWLHWWSYVGFAVAAPWGWITIIGPLAMLYFIVFVTGIPPTEKQSLKSRGEAYRRYQQTTSAFFPWFPRKAIVPDNGALQR